MEDTRYRQNMDNTSYVVYSNKGGTGKTTLAFQLATAYAYKRRLEVQVVVIDLCPKANVSQALLAKTTENQLGSELGKVNVSKASTRLIELSTGKEYEQTVGGYLLAMLDKKDGRMRTFDCKQFLIKVHNFNQAIPDNVFLLCGDRYLDVLSKRLEQERQLFPTRHDNNPWTRVTLFIKDFIDSLRDDPNWNYSFVIDTNPNFSIYTEMALSAAKRLIVPFTADDFSLSAIETMLYMVYGYDSVGDERLESFKESQYFWLAQKNRIDRSKLYLFVFNRVTFYDSRSASAFASIRDRLVHTLKTFEHESHRKISKQSCCCSPGQLDDDHIKEHYIVDVHDFHSKGIVSLHSGCRISEVENDYNLVYGSEVNISSDKNSKYYKDICRILTKMYPF
ncbi:unnamed protein product [Mytilus coruscus]|uniref:AAA domain-containing protein n=1 Tax=Mytilus coruscus TaxID=42192 RepID=A0A6J7ZRU0_MYTCO|nr:unnamed protein product [Mytilus coruscus]